jgi:RNA exonuclease 4
MAPVISSNWKSLQSKLKETGQVGKKKTKSTTTATDGQVRSANTLQKRKRVEAKRVATAGAAPASAVAVIGTNKRRKMGLGSSTVEESKGTLKDAPSASLALWAEDNDISPQDLAEAYGVSLKESSQASPKADRINEGLAKDAEIGQYVAIDCEMVGVGGEENRSVLARVSMVNYHGTQIYDSFVKPKEFVTDWRTHVSGIAPKHMAHARSFEEVQTDVAAIIKDRILIGHAIRNDLEVLMLGHPKKDIRDTSRFSGFRKYSAGRTPSLKKLAQEVLGVEIQTGEHSSIEDARATMLLFRRFKQQFDIEHQKLFPVRKVGEGKAKKKNKNKAKR